ncbi:MAG TPA: hypothetical protein VG826_14945 [Pirellulales bacterium]|nr:hypothetical protein [Pirellulales bacterium]
MLDEHVQAFVVGRIQRLTLIGDDGIAKSRSVRAALGGKGCWIEGNVTPFAMYVKLYHHRDQLVVIDDIDGLYATSSSILRLLKCLCQDTEEKTIAWHRDARKLKRLGIPGEFTTRSRVVIIANNWSKINQAVVALQDHGHVLVFQPGAAEVHRQAGTWFNDPEIYDWFAANLHRVNRPSLRHYVRASELKAAGEDWTVVLADEPEEMLLQLIVDLLVNLVCGSTTERLLAFVQLGRGVLAIFFTHCRRLGGHMRSVWARKAPPPAEMLSGYLRTS